MNYDEMRLLSRIHSPKDLKTLSENELYLLSNEIREYLVSTVSKNGGHLSSNLGIVELTIALHLCFNFEKDRLVFDVGHQSYVHKILTGRSLSTLRQKNGISGFPKTAESEFDAFNVGHSSTSISAALGILRAFRLMGDADRRVVALIGDGALSGGLAYEALDDAGEKELPLIVILNDNDMSIGGSVGGVSTHLTNIRTSKGYKKFKKQFSTRLKKIPVVGDALSGGIERLKNRIKFFILPNVMFEELGFTYMGPVDGHDIGELVTALKHAKNIKDKPVLIHVITKKGKGYIYAEKNPEKFHGIGKFNPETGESKSSNSNSKVFADELCRLAEKDGRIVAITAAMAAGTGLIRFKEEFPERFFDVGIAEQHGVTMAAGMAITGLRPVFAVYSTFLQRGYDQLLHDVCLQNLPVVFGIDRAGLVGADGETHQGVYDIAYFSTLPNGIKLFSPSSVEELRAMLDYAIGLNVPSAIRYNRGLLPSRELNMKYALDEWEIISESIKPITIVATGRLLNRVIELIRDDGQIKKLDVGLVNARLLCPIDDKLISILDGVKKLITIEDGNFDTGFGAQTARLLSAHSNPPQIFNIGVPNVPIEAASIDEQDEFCGLSKEQLRKTIISIAK